MEYTIVKGKKYIPPPDIFESEKEERMAKIAYNEKVKEAIRYMKAMRPKEFIITYSNMHLIYFDEHNATFELLGLYYVSTDGKPFLIVKEFTESFEDAITWIKEK